MTTPGETVDLVGGGDAVRGRERERERYDKQQSHPYYN